MKLQQGFSLIEVAIVLVIVGTIIGAIAVGKDAKTAADATKFFKTRVESCLAASFWPGNHKKYDGSEIDHDGRKLKNFCKIIKDSKGKIKARIYLPSKRMAVLMYEKSKQTLSDDFKMMPNPPRNRDFLIVTSDGYGVPLDKGVSPVLHDLNKGVSPVLHDLLDLDEEVSPVRPDPLSYDNEVAPVRPDPLSYDNEVTPVLLGYDNEVSPAPPVLDDLDNEVSPVRPYLDTRQGIY